MFAGYVINGMKKDLNLDLLIKMKINNFIKKRLKK